MTTVPPQTSKASRRRAFNLRSIQLNLRTYLVVPFLVQTVATVGLVGFLSFRHSQKAVNELAAQLQDAVSQQVAERVRSFLNTPQRVNALNADAANLGIINFANIEAARPFLWKQVNSFSDIGYTGLVDSEGRFMRIGWATNRLSAAEEPQLAVQNSPGSGDLVYFGLDRSGNPAGVEKVRSNFAAKESPLFKAALAAGKPTWGPVTVNFGYDNLQLNAVAPYLDAKGKLLGVFNTQIGLDQISNFLKSLKVSTNSKIFIFERSGELIASSAPKQPLIIGKGDQRQRVLASQAQDPVLQEAMRVLGSRVGEFGRLYESHQYEFRFNGDRQLMKVSPLEDGKGLRWLLLLITPESDFMSQVDASSRNTIFLCIGSVVFAIFLGVASSQWVTDPIEKIAQAARRLAGGDLKQNVDRSVIIEIDQLGGAFNDMTLQLQDSFEALEQSNRELTLAEENYRSIFENAQDGIFQATTQGALLRANAALAAIYGFSSVDEMLERVSDVDAQLFQSEAVASSLRQELEQQGLVTDYVYTCSRENGSSMWVEMDARLVRDGKGQTLYLEAILRDVSERKQREEALERQLRDMKIEIDQTKKEKDVAMLTSSSYFQEAKQEIANLDLESFWS